MVWRSRRFRRSLESHLVFRNRLIGLDRRVGDAFSARFDGSDRQVVEHAENAGADASTQLENAAQALHGQHAWLPQREIADDGEDKLFELFACSPPRQSDGVEATR